MEEKNIFKRKKESKIRFSDVLGSLSVWWFKFSRLVFVFLMLISMALGIFFWYKGLNLPVMNEKEKNDYRVQKDKGVDFLEKDFNEMLEYLNKREIEYSIFLEERRDVFK